MEHRKNKKSMEIENIPVILKEELQKKLIDEILSMNDIGTIAKAYLIRKNENISYNVAFEYLMSMNYNTMLTYLKRPDMSIPAPNSASKWSEKEIEYYLITPPVDVDEKKFGVDQLKDLPLDVKNFLDFHNDDFLVYYKKALLSKSVAKTKVSKFAMKYISYFNETNRESLIDNLMASFLDNVFGKEFVVDTQTPLKLKVNENDCEAITDVCVIDGVSGWKCVVVVEEKTDINKEDKEGNPLAQLIAEGIAVAEQSDWKEEWPVYMVLCKGLRLNFYQASFSEIFLNNVRMGFDCSKKTILYHLDQEMSLETEKGRFSAARVFCQIGEECEKRRN